MSSSVCRRLRLAIEDSFESSALRAQLFLALASYGVLEFISFDDSISGGHPSHVNFTNEPDSISSIVAQFQKLSCAEVFHADVAQVASQAHQQWNVTFEPSALPFVSSSLFISSINPLIANALPELSSKVPSHSASRDACGKTVLWLEEKLLKMPGSTSSVDALSISYPSISQATLLDGPVENFQSFLRDIAVVRAWCIGSYVGMLHFSNAHDAEHYLRSYQLSLAKQEIFIMYLGPSTKGAPAGLAQAASRLLTRRVLSSAGLISLPDAKQTNGLIRGFAVKVKANGRCVVDAGITTESHHSVMVDTHSNSLRVAVGDEVYIELLCSSIDTTGSTTRAKSSAFELGLRGVLKSVVEPYSSFPSQLAVPPNASSGFRRGQLSSTGARSASASAISNPQLTPSAAKALANKLFQTIRQAKDDGTLSQPEATDLAIFCSRSSAANTPGGPFFQNMNRLCAYPRGLRLLSQVFVQVKEIVRNGLNCTLLSILAPQSHSARNGGSLSSSTETTESGGWPPVFIPQSLIPIPVSDSNYHYATPPQVATRRGDWRSFAVVGERLTVAILYTTSIGDTHSTRQLIASKLDVHLQGAVPLSPHTDSVAHFTETHALQEPLHESSLDQHGKDNSSSDFNTASVMTIPVGLCFQGTPVHTITASDIGGFAGGPFPCQLVVPSLVSPPTLWRLPLVITISSSSLDTLDRSSAQVERSCFVVSEIMHTAECGHYVLLSSPEDYKKRVEREAQLKRSRQIEQWKEVRNRLASVLGDDAVQGLHHEDDLFVKKTRTE